MNFDTNIIKALMQHETPFYYYDTDLLKQTLQTAQQAALQIPNSLVHFAIKSNANPRVLQYVRDTGFGADCVSGGEIQLCLKAGIPADKSMLEKRTKRFRLPLKTAFCASTWRALKSWTL